MMAGPPGDPTDNRNLPSLSNTMVGDMAESGRLPGAGALATGFASSTGSSEKSVRVLLRKNPFTITSAPNTDSTEVVMEITWPVLSTMVMWLVPCNTAERCGAYSARFCGGAPPRAGALFLWGLSRAGPRGVLFLGHKAAVAV